MTFTQLEIFALVADLRGFTAAALRLGISQSAVSHAIKSLENELGVELVLRQQAAVQVTEVGKRLLTRSREILGLSEAMKQEAASARGLNEGLVRVGSFGPTSSLKLLPAILKAFRARYPGIAVQIDEAPDHEVRQWILERRVDIGFVLLPDDAFDTVQLAEDEMVAILPRGHALAGRSFVTPADLVGEPFILSEQCAWPLVLPVFAGHGLAPQVRYRMTQVLTILGMVEAGEGISIMPELALPADVGRTNPQLATVALRPAIRRRVGLGMRDLARAAPAVKAFIEIARKTANNGKI
jgi:DNA-binding transcriptional LysR family regulator